MMNTRPVMMLILLTSVSSCTRPAGPAQTAEPLTLNVTSWSARTELYMEYPVLVAGQPARFAVHLTKLDDFKALNAGHPVVEMVPEKGGAPITVRGSDPLRPGAFRVEMTPPASGRYRWSLVVEAPGLSDRHDL